MTKNPERPSRKTKPADNPKPAFKLARGKTVARTGSANQAPSRDHLTALNPNDVEASKRVSDLPQHTGPELTPQVGSESEPPVTQPAAAVEGTAPHDAALHNNVPEVSGEAATVDNDVTVVSTDQSTELIDVPTAPAIAENLPHGPTSGSDCGPSQNNKMSVPELELAEADLEGQSAPAKEVTAAEANPALQSVDLPTAPTAAEVPADELTAAAAVASNDGRNGDEADALITTTEDVTSAINVKFPRCDAAVRKLAHDGWELADAVLAECSEPGPNGVRNASYDKIKAMREEIAQNHGIDLSFERIRKLRKAAAAFPAGRRRPGICLDAHLEAGSPEALDDIINRTPRGAAVTRAHVRTLKHANEDEENTNEAEEKEKRRDERDRQVSDQRSALQNLCLQLGRRAEQYVELCREIGRQPEPPPKDSAPSVAENLGRSLRAVLMTHDFDATTPEITAAVHQLVQAALVQQQ